MDVSPYLGLKCRTESQARADIFALGVKYAELRAAGKSTDGILRRAAITRAREG